GEAARAIGVEALAKEALKIGDVALHLAIVALLQEFGCVLANDLARVAFIEAKGGGAALDLGMQTDDRNARRFRLGHRRTKRAGIDEIDGNRIDALVDEIFDRLDLLVHVAFARGDDQLKSRPP